MTKMSVIALSWMFLLIGRLFACDPHSYFTRSCSLFLWRRRFFDGENLKLQGFEQQQQQYSHTRYHRAQLGRGLAASRSVAINDNILRPETYMYIAQVIKSGASFFFKGKHMIGAISISQTHFLAFGTPRPIPWIRPRMYVRRSIMYEKAAFCSPEEYSSVARWSVPLKFDKLCFLQEFY